MDMEDLARSAGLRPAATGLQGSDRPHRLSEPCQPHRARHDGRQERQSCSNVSDRHAKGDETAHSTGSVERSEVERDRADRAETPGHPSLPKIGKGSA